MQALHQALQPHQQVNTFFKCMMFSRKLQKDESMGTPNRYIPISEEAQSPTKGRQRGITK